ncbi:hypothetical protein IC63_14515 [Paracoccus sphaerophysae]|uniref:Uncharacterized protein n=2 Tax=Paracoccus sphaerophysae TaxID=690417 RepID=A0A099EW00_9RHOB|nr:hypothetical protein IC63_14515 [Paracoccus sphaerophysae]
MYKDEWGMVVNAPPPAVAPRTAAAQARDVLLPAETVLWEGAPRQGAGWRCLLRERDIILTALAALPGLALLAVGLPEHREMLGLAVAVGTATGIFTLARLGGQLRRARYLVTDRRAIVVSGSTILSIKHTASRPQRRATRCGTTIELGRGVTGNAAAARWESDQRLARLFSGPDNDAPVIAFRALEPSEAPFELLSRLAAAPPAHHRSPVPPLGGGFSA